MRITCGLCVTFLALTLTPAVYSQDLPVSVTRDVRREAVETIDVTSTGAGEMISGTLEGRGLFGTVEVFDARGNKLRTYQFRNGSIPVGFVSAASGRYRIAVTATPIESPGSYVLTLRRQSQSERLKASHVHPRQDYEGSRIARLRRDLDSGIVGAEQQFWTEIDKTGAPLVESIAGDAGHVLITFVWKETAETHNVLVQWPPAFYYADDYYMSRLPGTSLWHKTIRVHRGARFPYAFSPNDLPEERDITTRHDPLNPRRAYDESEGVYSLVELPGAPDDTWATTIPRRRGVVLQKTFESTLLKGQRNISIYTPPDYESDRTARPLVILFNGPMYIGSGVGPTVLDNLVAAGKIRPPVVCVIQSDPLPQLLTSRFAEAIATELVPHLRSTYRVGSDPKDVVVGGFSAAAVWAAYIALRHPNVIGNVLSQSGAFRFQLPGRSEPNSLSSMFADAPLAPVRFYIDSGLYEPFPSAQRPAHESALDESNTAGNRHFRDVLRAKGYDVIYKETGGGHDQLHWRATLAEALITLLPAQ